MFTITNERINIIQSAALNMRYILSYSVNVCNFLCNLKNININGKYNNDTFIFFYRGIKFTNLDVLELNKDSFWTTQSLIENMGYNLSSGKDKLLVGQKNITIFR